MKKRLSQSTDTSLSHGQRLLAEQCRTGTITEQRHLYGFLEAGRMRLEYGLKGASSVEVGHGDFFHIPPRLVHRDVNLDKKQKLVVVNILVGRGEPVMNVKSPRQA